MTQIVEHLPRKAQGPEFNHQYYHPPKKEKKKKKKEALSVQN
jgi:hypothetical protein